MLAHPESISKHNPIIAFAQRFRAIIFFLLPTVCVTCVWAGVDSVWEQKKPEARKMLENAAESQLSTARCVGRILSFVGTILKRISISPTVSKLRLAWLSKV